MLEKLIAFARSKGASDLHISAGNYPFIRILGEVFPVEEAGIIDREKSISLLTPILTEKNKEVLEKSLQVDFGYQFDKETRYRVNVYNTSNGLSGAFREIPTKIRTLEELNSPEILKGFSRKRNGLILICGPTGSGKSTTLAAMVDFINTNFHKHIITIEDPLEFVHPSKKCLVSHREVGKSATTFAQSLRGALREDPDVIMIGEMRDKETIQLALTAAETGHLVFATLHTSSAAKAIDRIVDVFAEGEKNMIRSMLSTSLRGVISQTLLKKKDRTGRVGLYEILVVNHSVQNLIRENQISKIESMMQIGSRFGMITLRDGAKKLYDEDIVAWDQVKNIIENTGLNETKKTKLAKREKIEEEIE